MTAQKKAEWQRRLGNLRLRETKQAVDLEYAHGFVKSCVSNKADPYQLLKLANTLELAL